MCLTRVCALSVISTLVINCLNSIQRFVDLGWYSASFFWIIPVTLVTVAVLMTENKDRVLFLKMCAGGVCLSQGLVTALVLKLNKGTIMCVSDLLINHFCL